MKNLLNEIESLELLIKLETMFRLYGDTKTHPAKLLKYMVENNITDYKKAYKELMK